MWGKKIWSVPAVLIAALLLMTSCGTGDSGSPDSTGEKGGTAATERNTGPFPAQVSYVGNQQWGYIDDSGSFVIKPGFDFAARFQDNGLAVAGQAGKEGVIDRKGKFIIKPVYETIDEFSENRAIAFDGKEYRVLDPSGKVLYKSQGYINSYREQRAVIQKVLPESKFLYGYIDLVGKVVIQPRYQYATDFNNGRAVVQLDTGGYAIIDQKGTVVKMLDYNRLDALSEGLAAFQISQDSKFGYVDSNGRVVINPAFTEAYGFQDGYAVVNTASDLSGRQYGVIDKKGRIVIKPEHNDIEILGEGMFAVGQAINPEEPFIGSIYALAGKNGKHLTGFSFYSIQPFSEGVASADNGKSTFFINQSGQRDTSLPEVKGSGILELLNNLIYANIDNRAYYIDRSGKVVYRPSSSTTLKTGVTVTEVKYRPNRTYLVYYPQVSGLPDKVVEKSINDRLKSMTANSGVTPDMKLDYSFDGGFNITFSKKNLLELELWTYNFPFGAAHGMPKKVYIPIDIKTGRFYELKDLFKQDSDYAKVLSAIVKKQIAAHGEEMGVWADSYTGISPNQPFYVDAAALYLYFTPYEIAPYSSGFPTFRVPFTEIKSILDTKGAFWKSFN